jgi:hypothetical protein
MRSGVLAPPSDRSIIIVPADVEQFAHPAAVNVLLLRIEDAEV